jgi:hypothetical protein
VRGRRGAAPHHLNHPAGFVELSALVNLLRQKTQLTAFYPAKNGYFFIHSSLLAVNFWISAIVCI